MKAQLIVETIKALISLGCPGFEDLKKETKIYWDDVNSNFIKHKSECPKNAWCGPVTVDGKEVGTATYFGDGEVSVLYPINNGDKNSYYYFGSGGVVTTQILVKTKDGYITQEEACAIEKGKLRKLLWEKK